MYSNHELNIEEAMLDDAVYGEFDYLELPNSRKAFLFVGLAAIMAAATILIRAGAITFFSNGAYRAYASTNVSREIGIPSYRAVITDRYGEPLVQNVGSFSVFLSVKLVHRSRSELVATIVSLSEILHTDPSELLSSVESGNSVSGAWIPVARNISSGEAIAIKGLNHEDVQVLDDYRREYPDGPVFAHIIGYTGIGTGNTIIGRSGLEFQYDERIRGKDGRYVFYEDAHGEVFSGKLVVPPVPSRGLVTTIDADFQRFFYNRLTSALKALDRTSAVGVALDPRNGEVLAMVSLPTFDNNAFVDRVRSDERSAILTNPAQPLFHRAVSGMYSPGSTIKPLVALAALRESVVDVASQIFSSGVLEIPNPYHPEQPGRFLDWKAHGWVDLIGAIARSSNIYFYAVGGGLPTNPLVRELSLGKYDSSGLGIARLREYWKRFGFGRVTGIDLPAESSGNLPGLPESLATAGKRWRLGDTYNVSIGQGDLLVTPLQLASFMGTIANGGMLYRPFLASELGSKIVADYTEWRGEFSSVRRGLENAVAKPYGSSHILASLPFHVAGKTGTPQTHNRAKTNAFFAGYGPVEDPELVVLVFVEDAHEGSLNALPVARDVFRWYYDHRMNNNNIKLNISR